MGVIIQYSINIKNLTVFMRSYILLYRPIDRRNNREGALILESDYFWDVAVASEGDQSKLVTL